MPASPPHLQDYMYDITSVAWSPDSLHIVTASEDRTVRIWNAKTGLEIGEPFVGHACRVLCAAYSADGEDIVSGSNDGVTIRWAARMGEIISFLRNEESGAVYSVACSPDGQQIACGHKDSTIVVWSSNSERAALQISQSATSGKGIIG